MTKYRYEGEEELVLPTLGITIKNGDTFDGPEDLVLNKLVLADSKKSNKNAPAEPAVEPEDSEPVADSVSPDPEGA